MSDEEPLDRLRGLCLLLPETSEIDGLGHPTFRVSAKAFAVFEVIDGVATVCVKLPADEQGAALARGGAWLEPDTGHHGWTVVDVAAVGWDDVDPMVISSYRMVAAPELVVQLDGMLGEG